MIVRLRLSGVVGRGVDLKILIVLFMELEKVYDDFCVLNDEKLLYQVRNLVSIVWLMDRIFVIMEFNKLEIGRFESQKDN